MATTVLVTCAGGLGMVSVVRHLLTLPEVERVVGIDREGFGATAPLLTFGSIFDDVVEAARVLRQEYRVRVILPCSDGHAVALRPELAVWTDKASSIDVLHEEGFPTPEILDAPFVVKPTRSSGSRGIVQYDEHVAQEYLPGRDWSVDFVGSHGELLACVPRVRVRARGVSLESVVDPFDVGHQALMTLARQFVSTFRVDGLWNLQAKEKDGTPYIYEVNPRVGASCMMGVLAGVDLFRAEVRRQLGLPPLDYGTPRACRIARHYTEVVL